MNTLKTLVVLTVLVMVGYGLYVGLNNGFQFENLQTVAGGNIKKGFQSEKKITISESNEDISICWEQHSVCDIGLLEFGMA